jgi:hypothetical protein
MPRGIKANSEEIKVVDSKSFASSLFDSAVKKFGDDGIVNWDSFLKSVKGIPITNNLPLQFLFGIDGLPLSRWISIVGPPGGTKSSFCWYLSTFFLRHSGIIPFIDTEHKNNPNQVNAIVRAQISMPKDEQWFHGVSVDTLDDMLDKMIWYVGKIEEATKSGVQIPLLMIVDSLGNVTSKDAVDKRIDDGEAVGNTVYMRNAAKIKNDMQVLDSKVFKLPVMVLMVNHQHEKMMDPSQGRGRPSYMPPEKTEGGGVHKDFKYTWTIELTKVSEPKMFAGYETRLLRMKGKKISTGPMHDYPIMVRYKFAYLEDNTQVIWYDWDEALTMMLTDEAMFKRKDINGILDIKVDRKMYSSSRLGGNLMTATEFGKAIHSDPIISKEIQQHLFHVVEIEKYGQYRAEVDKPAVARPVLEEQEYSGNQETEITSGDGTT